MIRRLKNFFHLLNARISAFYYGNPGSKMKVIGITGTSGKTTTSHMIYHMLNYAGKRVSMVSTVEAIINGRSYDTGFHVTTPSPWQLQKFMHDAHKGGSEYFILEVTSHALDQNRTLGSSVDIAVITNIVHEHLDYHKTLEAYKSAKAKLLDESETAILNKDDLNFAFLKKRAKKRVCSYAIDNKADFTLNDFNLTPSIPGKFNLYNALAAATVGNILGIDKKTIEESVKTFTGIPGRMEKMKTDKPFSIYIDFAHKPDALEQALITVKAMTKGKLTVVFGCAGLRDRLKRPIMGEIAGKIADYIILTAEDPRTEDVRDIINQIAAGCLKAHIAEWNRKNKFNDINSNTKYFWRIPDRQEAINFAIRNLLQKGDTIICCGKGHEQSMCYGKTEYPWDEKKAIMKAVYDKSKNINKFT